MAAARRRGKTLNGTFKLNSRLIIQCLNGVSDPAEHLATKLKVDELTARRWLQKDHVPSVDHLIELSLLLDVPTDKLLLPLVG